VGVRPRPEPGVRSSIERQGEAVVGVEQWAELRRLQFVGGVSIRELQRPTGLHRTTIRRALRGQEPPRYQRRAGASKLDPFRDEIQRLLREDPRLPTSRCARADRRAGICRRQDAGL
jgi:transposase